MQSYCRAFTVLLHSPCSNTALLSAVLLQSPMQCNCNTTCSTTAKPYAVTILSYSLVVCTDIVSKSLSLQNAGEAFGFINQAIKLLFLIVLTNLYTTNLSTDGFRKFINELYHTWVFVRSSYLLHVVLKFFD